MLTPGCSPVHRTSMLFFLQSTIFFYLVSIENESNLLPASQLSIYDLFGLFLHNKHRLLLRFQAATC